MDYGLDLHCQMILDEYRELLPAFKEMKNVILDTIRHSLDSIGLLVTGVEARVKKEKSLAGKLELKGHKYSSLSDITDIIGARIITFYSDDVDKISSIIEQNFEIDWENSVDKRKMHQLDSFGYMSLHYICTLPEKLYHDPAYPQLNQMRFEIQMRTALQHVWATAFHDSGYKSDVEIPYDILRNLNCLAGLLELADNQFSRIRNDITEYRRKIQSLVAKGSYDEVALNGDTWRSYLNTDPFEPLVQKIAAVNQAEVFPENLMYYLDALIETGINTLGDLEKMKAECSDDAYHLAVHQIGKTDLDIISSSIALTNLCVVYILKRGQGIRGLFHLFLALGGTEESCTERAKRTYNQALKLKIIEE